PPLLPIFPYTTLFRSVNNNAGDAIGETQSEVAVAVYGDTVVVGWNDSKGFTPGFTISSFGYSTDGGGTFTDGGNMPLALGTDQRSEEHTSELQSRFDL